MPGPADSSRNAPTTVVSGVRSSWETMASRSSFIWSVSLSLRATSCSWARSPASRLAVASASWRASTALLSLRSSR